MSADPRAVRRGLYGKMAGDTTLTAMLATPPTGYSKSIFHEEAPPGAVWPYVIFFQSAGTPTYTLTAVGLENDVWTIKGVDKSGSADVADTIAARLDALLTDGALSMSGQTQLYLRRETRVGYPEVKDGVTYRHSGYTFRLKYQAT